MYDKPITRTTTDSNGYVYFIDHDHPLKITKGRVYLHRHNASLAAGAWIQRDMIVHHLNRDKSDNRTENLLVLTAAEHNQLHAEEDMAAIRASLGDVVVCPHCGVRHLALKSDHACASVNKGRRVDLSKEELRQLLLITSFRMIGDLLGVSDNAIRKWAKRLGLPSSLRGVKELRDQHRQDP